MFVHWILINDFNDFLYLDAAKDTSKMGGSPGLVVMGGDSRS